MPDRTANRKRKYQLLLLLTSVAASLLAAELLLRIWFRNTAYIAGPQYQLVQSHLQAHDRLGFLWRPDFDFDRQLVIQWLDKDPQLSILATDPDGFKNSPQAVAAAADRVDIIGLGDSFIHDAAFLFTEFFGEHGLNYYNLAMQRYCPPQYNLCLTDYGLTKRPKWVIYGLFANDFIETYDFQQWQASGEDWFTYHSGLWCGPPSDVGWPLRLVRRHLKGGYTCYRYLRARLGGDLFAPAPVVVSDEELVGAVYQYTLAAAQLCRQNQIAFLPVLIPSRTLILSGADEEDRFASALIYLLHRQGIQTLDLRLVFSGVTEPAGLYYREDEHWNAAGMRLAAEAILNHVSAE